MSCLGLHHADLLQNAYTGNTNTTGTILFSLSIDAHKDVRKRNKNRFWFMSPVTAYKRHIYHTYLCISWFPQTELPRTCPLTGLAASSGRGFPHSRNEPLISIGRYTLAAAIGQVRLHEIECSSSNLLLHAPRTSRKNKTNL